MKGDAHSAGAVRFLLLLTCTSLNKEICFISRPGDGLSYCCFQSEPNPKPMPGMERNGKIILERSRTALCRLIDATTKPSSALNTAPISDFFGPAAQKIETFSRARKKSWIRILPPEPALQTYTFWPIGVNQRRWLARYCSVPAFFCTDGTAASNVVMNAKKKWTRILCREPGSRLCPFTARPAR